MVVTARHAGTSPVIAGGSSLAASLSTIKPIGLDELGQRNLQDRFDTKFLFSAADLPRVLDYLADDYRVLEINGVRLLGYQTLYFDTPGYALYYAQHAGRPERYKVRARRYVETCQAFLEIKHKDAKGRTIKDRVATGSLLTELDEAASAFINDHVPFIAGETLEPKLWNRFGRITLVSRNAPERVTLDLDLGFGAELITAGFPGLIVAELKQEGHNRSSPFLTQMRLRNVHQTGFSKYCIGAALLNCDLKHNRFRPELLRAQRISERGLIS